MLSRASLAISVALFAPAFLGCGQSDEPARTEPAADQTAQATQTPQTEPTTAPPTTTPDSEPTTQAAGTTYPAEIRKNFINACEANGGSASQCSCALDEVEKNFTLDEFLEEDAASRASGGAPSPRVTAAVAKCQ